MDEMSLSAEEEKHLWLKVEDTLPLATTMLRPFTATLSCAQSSDHLLLCLWRDFWLRSQLEFTAVAGTLLQMVTTGLQQSQQWDLCPLWPPSPSLPSWLLWPHRTPTGDPGWQQCLQWRQLWCSVPTSLHRHFPSDTTLWPRSWQSRSSLQGP